MDDLTSTAALAVSQMSQTDLETPPPSEQLGSQPSPTPTPSHELSSSQMQPMPSPSPAPSQSTGGSSRRAPRMVWRSEMTISFLELLLDHRGPNGLSTKTATLKPIMERILPQLNTLHPRNPFSVDRLLAHLKSLRLKHRIFLWMTSKSGVDFDRSTGEVFASDEQWLALESQFGPSSTWLRTVGLPRPDLYNLVFASNAAGGATVVSAADAQGIEAIDLTNGTVPVDDVFDEPEEQESSQQMPLSSPAVPRTGRQHTGSLTPSNSNRSRFSQQTTHSPGIDANSGGIVASISQLANSISSYTIDMRQQSRGIGVDDIEKAISDGRETFHFEGEELAAFMKGLTKPYMAVLWNNCRNDLAAKEALLRDIFDGRRGS